MKFIVKNRLPTNSFIKMVACLCVIIFSGICHAAPEAVSTHVVDQIQAKNINTNQSDATKKMTEINTKLATKNASLEQENNALQTQVNVLTAERSSQLFMTGAFVAIGGIFLGFIAAWLMLGRRGNDW